MTQPKWAFIGLLVLALLLGAGLSRPNTVEANTRVIEPDKHINMALATGTTLTVAVNPSTGLVGSTLKADLKLTNASNLYGLQVDCTVNPAVLTGQTRTDGTIFTSGNSFILDSNPQSNGMWSLSGSLLNPAPAFSGAATAFTLNYKVLGAGDSPINCVAMAVDASGNEVAVTVVNGSFSATSCNRDLNTHWNTDSANGYLYTDCCAADRNIHTHARPTDQHPCTHCRRTDHRYN